MGLYDWLPFLHVLGAFAAVASVVVFTVVLLAGDATPGALRLTGLGDLPDNLDWTGIGFSVSDGSVLLLIVATVACGFALRRLRRSGGHRSRLAGIATGLISLTLVAYGVAVWAMTTKPGA